MQMQTEHSPAQQTSEVSNLDQIPNTEKLTKFQVYMPRSAHSEIKIAAIRANSRLGDYILNAALTKALEDNKQHNTPPITA